MRFLRSVLGYMLVGLFVMTVWGSPIKAEGFGVFSGWLSAGMIIAPFWFVNHYLGLIPHDSDSAFVDMGMGVAMAGIFRDAFANGIDAVVASVPTFLLICVGASIGGFLAAKVQKNMEGGK